MNEITIPIEYIARLSGLIEATPKKPAAPKAIAFTLNTAMNALAKPEPIMAEMNAWR